MTSEPNQIRESSSILSAGFRLFFLLAGLAALGNGLAWLAWLGVHAFGGLVTGPSIGVAPHLWHGHEMIFGYALATLAGFFLTAVPSWSGTAALRGSPLLFLGLVWIAGRAVIWFSAFLPPWLVAAVDLAFIPALALFVGRALSAKPAPRHLIVMGVLGFLFVSNVLVHLDWLNLEPNLASTGLAGGVLSLVTLIGIIGGRIVPAFTRNALASLAPSGPEPVSFKWLEVASILPLWLLLGARLFAAPDQILAAVAGFAGLANAARLIMWRGGRTLHSPILWSLHLGYAWLPLGLALLALSYGFDLLPESAAMHALAIGAVGGMTLAVMSRAALGHSGRALVVARPMAWAYALVSVTAILRVAAPSLAPGLYMTWILAAGAAWCLAFLIYLAVFWPILTGPPERSGT